MARRGPVRLTVVDDNPFVRTPDGSVHAKAATFHRWVEALAQSGPFGRIRYIVPVRRLAVEDERPTLPAIDGRRLEVIESAPFHGAADHLARAPLLWARNLPRFARAIRGEHLCLIKVPASNAPLAALCCAALGVPRVGWIAGSTREVVAASDRRGPGRWAALAAGWLYDGVSDGLAATGPAIRLGADLFTSALEPADLGATVRGPRDSGRPPLIAWAGRMAPEKDLDTLLEAVTILAATRGPLRLRLVGDGPVRGPLEARARTLGMTEAVEWTGYLGDRAAYLAALADADVFCLPSRAEGVPKALVEAMALGVPVVATPVGDVPAVLGHGERGRLVRGGDELGLARAIDEVLQDREASAAMATRARAWAAERTSDRQAERLVERLRDWFPDLPWPAPASG